MITDLIGGQVEFGALALPAIQATEKRRIARHWHLAKARLAAAPEIPTFAEQGLPNYIVEGWFAVIGPKNLPATEVKRTTRSVYGRLCVCRSQRNNRTSKATTSRSKTAGEAATAFFKSEMEKYAKLVKNAGVCLTSVASTFFRDKRPQAVVCRSFSAESTCDENSTDDRRLVI